MLEIFTETSIRPGNESLCIRDSVLNVPWVSLVNLNLGREAVAEIIQSGLDITRAERELRAVVEGGSKREKMLSDFDELRKVIGGPGASDRFAARIDVYKRQYLHIHHVARNGQRHEHHHVVPASHRLAFGGERRYFKPLDEGIICLFASNRLPICGKDSARREQCQIYLDIAEPPPMFCKDSAN